MHTHEDEASVLQNLLEFVMGVLVSNVIRWFKLILTRRPVAVDAADCKSIVPREPHDEIAQTLHKFQKSLVDRSSRFAVLVGIDDYSNLDGVPSLKGCADDAQRLAPLISGQGFEVQLLTNETATRAKLEDAFATLCQDGEFDESSVVILFFSGHGMRGKYDTDAKHEADFREDALVLCDGILIDDDLAKIISSIPKQATVVVLLDCCHSAGLGFEIVQREGPTLFISSSEEDATSMVAPELAAGGYLSFYIANVLGMISNVSSSVITVGSLQDGLLTEWPKFCTHHDSQIVSLKGRSELGRQWPVVLRTAPRSTLLFINDCKVT